MLELSDELLQNYMRGIPRRVPQGTIVIDTYPLRPIPEDIAHVMADLLGQLALAEAPFSDQRTACVLVGENTGYGGHVVEHSPTDIEDPFTMALDAVPADTVIYGAMVTGEGPMKEKHTLPSAKALDRLNQLLVRNAKIVVVPPNNRELCRFIPARMLRAAYEPKTPSVFQAKTFMGIVGEATENTALSLEDCEFVAHLRLAGLESGIHYYLTGSANGDSGPSFALKPGRYSDLDIIAVSDLGRDEVEASFETVAQACYGLLEKVPKVVRVTNSNRMLEGCIYSNEGIAIDFYVSNQLEQAFVRPESFEGNYFHQLS